MSFPVSVSFIKKTAAAALLLCAAFSVPLSAEEPVRCISNALGIELLETGDTVNAESCFRKAILDNPKEKHYYNNIAVSLMRQEKYMEAYGFLLTALGLDRRYTKALANMALACFYLGEYSQAYSFYRRAYDEDRSYIVSRFTKEKARQRIDGLTRDYPDNGDFRRMKEILEKTDPLPR